MPVATEGMDSVCLGGSVWGRARPNGGLGDEGQVSQSRRPWKDACCLDNGPRQVPGQTPKQKDFGGGGRTKNRRARLETHGP